MDAFQNNTCFIAVHVGSGSAFTDPLLARVCPPGNWIGAMLASHIVKVALQRAGLLMSPECSFSGELTDCVLFAEVSDVASAIAIIKAELDATPLQDIYQIGVRQDCHWRAVHPNPAARVDWLFDTDRMNAALENVLRQFRRGAGATASEQEENPS